MKIKNYSLEINKRAAGFTLIELIVVVGILAAVIAAFLLAFNPFVNLQKARDAQRRHDLEQLRNAASVYYNDNNCFPQTLDQLTPTYITSIPNDPLCNTSGGYCYVYQTNTNETCPQWASFYAHLELGGGIGIGAEASRSTCPVYAACGFYPQGMPAAYNLCMFAGKLDCSYLGGGNGGIFPTGYYTQPTPTPTETPYTCEGILEYSCIGTPSRCNHVPAGTGTYCGFTECLGNACCDNQCEVQ